MNIFVFGLSLIFISVALARGGKRHPDSRYESYGSDEIIDEDAPATPAPDAGNAWTEATVVEGRNDTDYYDPNEPCPGGKCDKKKPKGRKVLLNFRIKLRSKNENANKNHINVAGLDTVQGAETTAPVTTVTPSTTAAPTTTGDAFAFRFAALNAFRNRLQNPVRQMKAARSPAQGSLKARLQQRLAAPRPIARLRGPAQHHGQMKLARQETQQLQQVKPARHHSKTKSSRKAREDYGLLRKLRALNHKPTNV